MDRDYDSDSQFVEHVPCGVCDSSDGRAVYDDGHSYCFSCQDYQGGKGKKEVTTSKGLIPFSELEYKSLVKRRISQRTCQIYRYGISPRDEHVACYVDPKTNKVVGQKLRGSDKKFSVLGDKAQWRKMPLFGQSLFKGSRQLIICEGEMDTLSMAEIQNCKWPVVGIPNGTDGAEKACVNNLEFIESFEKVIFMFDMDDPGQKAAKACAELLTPGKAHIATLPLGDVSDMLQAQRADEVVAAMWNARPHSPDDLAFKEAIYAELTKDISTEAEPYPWAGWNAVTHGIRRGELVMLSAGTGIGKSTAFRAIAYHLSRRKTKVAYIALEESLRQSALQFIGMHIKKPLHLENKLETHELAQAFDEVFGQDHIVLYDHFGSIDTDKLMAKIRYLARAGYEYIFIDHITLMMSGSADQGDERRKIDAVMTKMRSQISSLNIALLAICHPRRGDSKSRTLEEGGRMNLSLLRGTSQIAALSDIVIGLERDQQGDEPNVVTCRCLKNRFSGVTGLMGQLYFDQSTMGFTTYRGHEMQKETESDDSYKTVELDF
jgi:twinkle protein